MQIPRPIPSWTPSTPQVCGEAIDELAPKHPAIAVHFWAPWNGYDPLMDRSIQAIAERFDHRIFFVSCNIDLEENAELCRRCGVANIPALAVLISGIPRRLIKGCFGLEELAAEIESRLGEPEREPFWLFWKKR